MSPVVRLPSLRDEETSAWTLTSVRTGWCQHNTQLSSHRGERVTHTHKCKAYRASCVAVCVACTKSKEALWFINTPSDLMSVLSVPRFIWCTCAISSTGLRWSQQGSRTISPACVRVCKGYSASPALSLRCTALYRTQSVAKCQLVHMAPRPADATL